MRTTLSCILAGFLLLALPSTTWAEDSPFTFGVIADCQYCNDAASCNKGPDCPSSTIDPNYIGWCTVVGTGTNDSPSTAQPADVACTTALLTVANGGPIEIEPSVRSSFCLPTSHRPSPLRMANGSVMKQP